MIKSIKRHKKFISIQLLFILLTFLFSLVFLILHNIQPGDIFYHLYRARDISINILYGHFPSFSFSSGKLLGNANMSFYPWLSLIPTIPFIKILTPLHLIQYMISVGIFLGLELTYYTARTLKKSTLYCYTFSIFYMLSSITLSTIYGQDDIGALYGLAILPLAFIGWYHWIHTGQWKMLTCGVTVAIFVHLPTVGVLCLCLILSTGFFINYLTKRKIINLIKAIITTTFCSAMMWMPLIILYMNNKLWLPSQGTYKILDKDQQPLLFAGNTYFIPTEHSNWGIIDIIAIIFIITTWKSMKSTDKRLFYVVCIIFFSNIYPINVFLMKNTMLGTFQFMHRFCLYSHLLLSFILTNIIFRIFAKQNSKSKVLTFLAIITTILNINILYGEALVIHTINIQPIKHSMIFTPNHTVPNDTLDNKLAPYLFLTKYPDYYPKSAINTYHVSFRHIFTIHYRKFKGNIPLQVPKLQSIMPRYNKYNGFQKRVKHTKFYKIPVVTYHQQKYNVLDNGKKTSHYSSNHFMYVKMYKGNNDLHFYTPMMWYRYLAIFCSFIGFLSLIPYKKHHYSR